jgi:hypothetical protein
MQGLVTI